MRIEWSRPAQAAIWLALVAGLVVWLYLRQGHLVREEFTELVTRPGERKKVQLEDGTVVWLNAASKLHYPDSFAPDRRQVSLEGEAFFEVTKDAARPFIIRSGDLETTVLGTSFNIRAYQEDKTLSVAVVSGRVKVAAPDTRSELLLVPDQQAVFNKQGRRLNRNEKVFASGLSAWKDGLFQFRNTTFSEVTAILQRSHNVRIQYDQHLENCPIIHADFYEDEPVENILKTLLSSVNGRVKETGKGAYYLTSPVACQPPIQSP
nr:FecR family protein [Rhabdobacter roseus]